jgi:hypothetical protein
MGAWGHGHFENDAALDFMADIEESNNPKDLLNEAFDTADADYLETDVGTSAIVAAAYVDRQINGTRFTSSEHDEPLEVDTFPDRHPDQNFSDLKEKAVQALINVLDENSELNELWEENEEDYPAWRESIEQMIQRLGGDLREINLNEDKFNIEIVLIISGGDSSDAKINVTKNGEPYQTINAPAKKQIFELDFNENYLVECSKQGFTTKLFYLDTHLPRDKEMEEVAWFEITIELHKEEEGKKVDSSKPVGGIKYNSKIGDFEISRN